MAAPVVYDDVVEGANLPGQLFAGKKFWVAQRVYSRPRCLNQIKSNGGEIVLLEKKADYLIADHVRTDCPPGSISYKFIDKSIEKRELQDPEDYRAGPPEGTARASGSLGRPAKGTRAAYTAEEDRILYKWVHDCVSNGKLANGNEIYKDLEKLHPRHTWQSWRDRYVKILQQRPPSAFNIPDNAPPSPPSDAPVVSTPAPTQAQSSRPTMATPSAVSSKSSGSRQVNSVEYSVEELTAPDLFGKEDWEMLYAFAEDIRQWTGDKYRKGWGDWAEGRRQTAGQWRQYFEKVVWPTWRNDSHEKHGRIKSRVERRLEEEHGENEEIKSPERAQPRAGPSISKPRASNAKRKRADPDDDVFDAYLNLHSGGKVSFAFKLFASEQKDIWNERSSLDNSGLFRILESRWDALSPEEQSPYVAQEEAQTGQPANEKATPSSQVFLSSSTAVKETPKYISEAYEKARQQLREGLGARESFNIQDEMVQAAKRRRSTSPQLGTEQEPVEISSTGTDSQQLMQDELPDFRLAGRTTDDSNDSDEGGLEAIAPPESSLPQASIEADPTDPASGSPTPHAPRYRDTAFDTQAILSSPSQGASLHALALPTRLMQLTETEADDNGETLASDASTTESLQEFSQFVNEQSHHRGITPIVQPRPSSQASSPVSTSSSVDSGDPDPPLALDELDEYFDEQHAEGFTDEFIAAALKHTRWRPALATEVLQAWKIEQPLPNKRGIWSESDDEEVEGGDGLALARLENKHTLDGWGGVTERMNFLAKYRSVRT